MKLVLRVQKCESNFVASVNPRWVEFDACVIENIIAIPDCCLLGLKLIRTERSDYKLNIYETA